MVVDFELTGRDRELLLKCRRAVLATVADDGLPRLVPICYVVRAAEDDTRPGLVLYSPLDEKRKATTDVRLLARVRDLLARPSVAVLVDRWDEDWGRLAWLRLLGTASLLEPGFAEHAEAIAGLRRKYVQYREHALETRPIVKVDVVAARSWAAEAG